jgi:Tfp pilus assembly protein PilX
MDINMKTKTKIYYQSGAALLITMLIIATVGALALAVGRIVISELHITSTYSDSVIAYQAAESGIEQGLLEFRNDHNIEKSFPTQYLDSTKSQSYDLNIQYRKKTAGDSSDFLNQTLNKDQIIERDISKNVNSIITMTWSGGDSSGIVEYQILNKDNSQNVWKTIPSGINNISTIRSNDQFLRIKYLSNVAGDHITYSLSSSDLLDTGYTYIDSVGTYPSSSPLGTKIKLEAQIDRNSGQLIKIFDYTLYAGNGDIAGP